jgi:hypothetical protein
MYHLQDPLPDEEIERRIVSEYLSTEDLYLAAREKVPAGRLAELRMEDLMADPVGQVKRLYAELGLPYTDEFEQRLLEYLDATKSFEPNRHKDKDEEAAKRAAEALGRLRTTFGHDRPAVEKKEPPPPRCLLPKERQSRLLKAGWQAAVAGVVGLAVWLGLTWLVRQRLDGLAWIIGIVVGMMAITTARRGALGLGLWCGGVALATAIAGSAVTTAWLSSGPWTGWRVAEMGFVVFWGLLGTLGAFRLGTRRWI